MRKRADRIGVDLDNPSQLQLLKAYYNAQTFFPEKVEIRETGHGFHIRIHQHCPSIQKNIDVRRNLGDDPNRLWFDENRKKNPRLHDWIDTIFSWKLEKGHLTYEKQCNILALPSISWLPCRKP